MAGNRVYSATFDNVTVSAIQDVFSLLAAGGRLELHKIRLTSNGVADAVCRLRLRRFPSTVTVGSGGSAPTVSPVDESDAAGAATVRANDTTQATTTGTAITMWGEQWDVRAPFEYLEAPEDREALKLNSAYILDIPAAPTSLIISGYIKWREF